EQKRLSLNYTGLIGVTQGHLPTPIPSLHFTPYLSFISSSPGEDSQNKLPFARIRCPKVSMAYVSYCYALFIAPRTWMDADLSMTCQKRPSGHLVFVLSGPEGSFVASLAKNNLKLLSDVWIGLHDPTEPNASGWEWSSTDVSTSPIHLSSSVTLGYLKWRVYNCYMNLSYACKLKD
uniref:C-type lectin domain-containing protein n=1 Tax=Monodon monoceros TaxID=40151 RepID=A0A8C6B0V5_MONMO